jgi:hypothetical protein
MTEYEAIQKLRDYAIAAEADAKACSGLHKIHFTKMAQELPLIADLLAGAFVLDAKARAKLKEWAHQCIKDRPDTTAAGGRFTYEFSPCSIGMTIKVKDCYTQREIDLTDYDSW